MFQSATQNSRYTDSRVIGSQLAGQEVEQVIADKAILGYGSILTNRYPSQAFQAPYNNFTKSVVVTEVDPSDMSTPLSGSGYKRVDVTVQWGAQAYESVSISTVLTNYT